MTIIQQNALLPYPAAKMFDLINDIEAYPQFMQGCQEARILKQDQDGVTATLVLGRGVLKSAFTTRNILLPPETMRMELVDGPFRVFQAKWSFKPLGEEACKVSLDMEFEFNSGLLDAALKGVFDSACKSLVTAVCKRADLIYGNHN